MVKLIVRREVQVSSIDYEVLLVNINHAVSVEQMTPLLRLYYHEVFLYISGCYTTAKCWTDYQDDLYQA